MSPTRKKEEIEPTPMMAALRKMEAEPTPTPGSIEGT
jgi:hypothetical protein